MKPLTSRQRKVLLWGLGAMIALFAPEIVVLARTLMDPQPEAVALSDRLMSARLVLPYWAVLAGAVGFLLCATRFIAHIDWTPRETKVVMGIAVGVALIDVASWLLASL